MRLWFLALLVAIAVTVTVRAMLASPERPRRVGSRWPWITWAVLVVIAVPTAWFEWRWQTVERTLNAASQWAAQRPDAAVSCQRAGATMLFAGGESGHVMWEPGDARGSGSQAWLTWEMCTRLRDWLESDKSAPTLEQAIALHVAAHEFAHLAGERTESRAECAALLNDAALAVHLGATPEQAAAMAKSYVERVWPRLPSSYRGDCRAMQALPVFGTPAG